MFKKENIKILYFGTVCNLEAFNRMSKDFKEKPSVAPIVFESSLLTGFYNNGADVEIHSFPMIPTFPKSRLLLFGGKTEKLECGYDCRWLKTVNLPVLKQISRRMEARNVIKKWRKENSENNVIFTYSIPPFLVEDVLKYAKIYKMKTVAIIPDLLRDMYINENKQSFGYRLKSMYIRPALRVQGEYDGYIYLTQPMSQVVAPDKPYIVMEGIADINHVTASCIKDDTLPKSIMYAGMLHEKYGVLNLIDAFEMVDIPDVELWLFGTGTAVSQIEQRAKVNNKIKYFGTVDRNKVLEYEKKATLLVNPRDDKEEFTQYSFPSKTVEYMLSGTPLLTTKLKGIPQEYFEFAFTADSNSPDDLAKCIKTIFNYSAKELYDFGYRAQQFIIKEKNSDRQSERIIKFLKEVAYGSTN